MKTTVSSKRLAVSKYIPWVFLAHCLLLTAHGWSADPTPPRLFFSDAKVSFIFPNNWTLQPAFPYGPLFVKTTKTGAVALISCAISAPLQENRVSSDISQEVLKKLATHELELHQPGFKSLVERDRELAGHNAFEIIWQNEVDSQTLQHQSVYFYVENRVYALTLQSSPKTFRWLAPDFQHWLNTVQVLSRQNNGSLNVPAHGGLWIHQTGGVKISIPDPWLIAVADDRTLGATVVMEAQHSEFTATLDVSAVGSKEFSRGEKKEARKAIIKKGLRIVKETDEAFHGLPAFQIQYEGKSEDRTIKGMDLWVVGTKARWLFNIEGDVSLYNRLTNQYADLLKNIQFI